MSAFRREINRLKPSDNTSVNSDAGNTSSTAISPEPPDDDSYAPKPGDSESRRPSLIRRRFTSAWAKKRQGNSSGSKNADEEENFKGPLGLQLLHPSAEPLIDLIFVHGLKGDSVKTWRKGGDPRCFWPQLWLPMEPGFDHANIHTYGYDSDWASSKSSILNVHDFGQGLLEEMRNAPNLRESADRPIVLIGHSMGGLVIKKAFILSQDIPEFKTRIRSIFFLSTPHRGNDYASTLNNILTVSGFLSPRHYLADLTTGSVSLQLINDDFGRCAHELSIFSFYETLKTNISLSSVLVVDKSSAVLGPGYRNERVQYMDANHRDICKFSSVEDPNYARIRNALGSSIGDLLKDVTITNREESQEQMRALSVYLGVADSPDEHYQKVSGSCQWIDARDDFQDWRDCTTDLFQENDIKAKSRNLSIFWVHANPGAGKTVLASHVISQLQEFQLECAYYYFHAGNNSSKTLGSFLRSVAYQMAMSNSAIRKKLFMLCQEGSTFDVDDSQTIWTKLFKKGILQSKTFTPQFWVIDALDECNKYAELFTMLRGEKPSFPLRIFITSRNMHNIQRLQKTLDSPEALNYIDIPLQDSIKDIHCYIQSRIESLPIDESAEREELAAKILSKSNASFLWVRLVLDELENVYSNESILRILERIPEGMIPYYERTINTMASNTLEKHISKAVLLWTVACSRNLTITELSQALKLDINTVLPSAKSAVEGLCGQLVNVDDESGIVDLIHPTAREFLISSAGEFTVSKAQANTRIALVCLRLLSGNDMRPPRHRRFLAQARPISSPLLDYAMTQFSEHVYLASSENDELLSAMDRLFKTNALSWIERLALQGNLHCLIRTSKNLKAYLDRRAKYQSPLNSQVNNVDNWSTDLTRLVTQFGKALLDDPSAIYFLIPPLCPSASAIFQQFGKRPDALLVVGRKNTNWDDCIAYVNFGEDIAAATSCGESLIAVGMESGDINLFNHRSCQKEAVIRHKNPVDLVHISNGMIVSCTTRAIIVQDLKGNTIWKQRLRFRCLLLTSTEHSIMAVSQHAHLITWDRDTGDLLEDQEFSYQNFDVDTQHNGLASRSPQVASISPTMEVLALGYRGGAVCLWDIRAGEHLGWARDEAGRMAAKLLFNPNPNIDLLLVIYTNHGLTLYDTWSGNLIHDHSTPNNVGLLSASCSPDGRTLVTTDSYGNMHIWDFDSLSILYRVLAPFPSFRILDFTSDGSSVVDVMDSGMRIWSPAVLVRKNTEEDASTSDAAVHFAVTEGEFESRKSEKITVLREHPTSSVVFAGKHNGDVVAFTSTDSKPATVLYSHSPSATITNVDVTKSNTIASSDTTGIVHIRQLSVTLMEASDTIAEVHTSSQIKQLCFSESGEFLLISTAQEDCVYRVPDGSRVGSWKFEASERKSWRWFISPQRDTDDQHFSLISAGTVRTYLARSFPQLTSGFDVNLSYALEEVNDKCEEIDIETAFFDVSTKTLILTIRYDLGIISTSATFFFSLTDPSTSTGKSSTIAPSGTMISKHCKHVLGYSTECKRFVFLYEDSWVSSIDLNELQDGRYTRHFFVPSDYLPTSIEVLPVKSANDDLVFCLHGELVSIRNGMKFSTGARIPP